MKGVLFRRRLTAIHLLTLHTGSTLLLTGTSLFWTFPQKSWAAGELQITALQKQATDLKLPIEKKKIQSKIQNPKSSLAKVGIVTGNGARCSWGKPPRPHSLAKTPTSRQIQNSLAQLPVTIPVVPFELQNTPQRFQTSPQFGPYRLGPGDTLSVITQRFADLSFIANVSPEGKIVVPLLGTVSVGGLTLPEVQEKIRLGLNRYVIDPVVNVSLGAQRPVQVTITGAVVKPGFYNLGFPPRLSTALLTAGGSTTQADLRQIRVRRFLLDGSFIEQPIDLFTPLAAGDPLPDLRLEDGDAVIVPQLGVGNDATYDRQLVAKSTLSQQVINIRVLSYPNQGLGNIRLPNGSNFLDAFTAASPNLQVADLTRVALIRFDQERGRAIVRELNGKRALFGDASQNVPLRDNDVIVIGRNLVGRITYALNSFTQPFRDILGFLLFFRSLSNSANDLFSPSSDNGNGN
ncbi:polysaccharide biosynthesis/export family protein [Argonema antarcticum]|uniref:polysaccharide biosynthesis/export family protein n=1 Tax=Argonema antarcticum TaxID=2942763 RepID=UPI0020130E97|nr:polysaccharide biosynthesis/export family protein [Argonema antarcticum]MCL1471559.1 polysaccharide export protein [Argonema antarcticum A004/B2]